MPYCSKCGAEVREEMAFCPKCGAPLKVEARAPPRAEKAEKQEKEEKGEKTEKHEKREFRVIGPLIGGLILILVGVLSYLQVTGFLRREAVSAFFFITVGVVIVAVSAYATLTAKRRLPKPRETI